MLSVPQHIASGAERFVVTIQNRLQGSNGRTSWLVKITTAPASRRKLWEHRQWDDVFQLVLASDGHFITLFTQEKDPSKELVRQFFQGRLITNSARSLPVSALLFRSLVLYAAEDVFGPLDRGLVLPTPSSDHDELRHTSAETDSTWVPFLSRGLELWISYAFAEEKAHRVGLMNFSAAARLIVVYCQPTFSQHQRCNAANVQVLSLQEFVSLGAGPGRFNFLPQARLLINNLHLENAEHREPQLPASNLLAEIQSGQCKPIKIETSELREAKAGLGIVIVNASDVAYLCACANLINAALNKKIGNYEGSVRLSKDVYTFKSRLALSLAKVTDLNIPEVALFVAEENLVYVKVGKVQFSFHSIPRISALEEYAKSARNIPQQWNGVRLQPIAGLVLAWARTWLREDSA